MILSSSSGRWHFTARLAALALAVLVAAPLAATSAEARAGGGFSFGSRGSRSFSLPPSTTTAPRSAQPLPRSYAPGDGSGAFASQASQPRRFGFGTGLAAGLLGAGLFGMLTGSGFFGGLGGLASVMGLMLQVALLAGMAWLVLRWLRDRRGGAPAFAAQGAGATRSALGGPLRAPGGGNSARATPLTLSPADFDSFERALVGVQTAYGREDADALSRLATPDVVRRFGDDIGANRRRGLRNEVADPRLLQGDLAEAWREGATDYATVAMRFSVRDSVVDRSNGRLVEGDPTRPVEATELWTFRRERGGPWLVSAIQQAA